MINHSKFFYQTMKKSILIFSIAMTFISIFCDSSLTFAQDVFHSCKMEGTATSHKYKEENRKKNRYSIPHSNQFDSTITFEEILQPGNDINRFDENKAIIITGWVLNVVPSGEETCNCDSTSNNLKDVHIEIVPTENTTSRRKVIYVEITPRLRRRIFDQLNVLMNVQRTANGLLTNKLRGKQISVEGWLFFDDHHKHQAWNTDPTNTNDNKRASVWEIHPITKIEIID